jgi:hypothetical protein
MNEYFVSSFQKVASFRIANGKEKQGGNVASYFCTPKGQVLHIIAGPVDAAAFLREARWVVETLKLAQLEGQDLSTRLQHCLRKAHTDRLREEHLSSLGNKQRDMKTLPGFPAMSYGRGNWFNVLGNQGKVHLLLANYPMPRIERVYALVFERILNQKLSTIPVVQKN